MEKTTTPTTAINNTIQVMTEAAIINDAIRLCQKGAKQVLTRIENSGTLAEQPEVYRQVRKHVLDGFSDLERELQEKLLPIIN